MSKEPQQRSRKVVKIRIPNHSICFPRVRIYTEGSSKILLLTPKNKKLNDMSSDFVSDVYHQTHFPTVTYEAYTKKLTKTVPI